MPKFILSFAGSVYEEYILYIDGKLMGPFDYKVKGMDSLHIFGTKDFLFEKCLLGPLLYDEISSCGDGQQHVKEIIVH
jgi:hypothetical protein